MNRFMRYPVKFRFRVVALASGVVLCGLAGSILTGPPLYRVVKRHLRLKAARAQWENVLQGGELTDESPLCNLVILSVKLDIPVLGDSGKANLARLPCVSSLCPDFEISPVIVAHRDLHFNVLQSVEIGDCIYLTRRNGEREEYRVSRLHVVMPDVAESMAVNAHARSLTLITCYPFRYIGPAPERFVVVCARI